MTSPNGHASDTDFSQLGFEDAFRQLTEIAEHLESGGLTLAQATSKYEQGMRLVQHYNHLLDSAELEITTLRENYQRPPVSAGQQESGTPPFYDDDESYDELPDEEEDLPY